MNAPAERALLAAPALDGDARLAALRAAGAARHDPLRFGYLDALARRTARQPAAVRDLLEDKFAAALTDCEQRFAAARLAAQEALAQAGAAHPQAAAELAQLFESGDFAALRRRIAGLEAGPGPLAELLQHAERHAHADAGAAPVAELKAVRNFRDTWAQLSAARQVSHAIGQAPENAGPLNSHYLVLRSLELMRDISPDYLKRFLAYADTLLSLDQVADKPAARKQARTRAAKR
jgi:HPt (histidine-containing phosphotransfer) domain-containing protein